MDSTITFGDSMIDSTEFRNYCSTAPIACHLDHSSMCAHLAFTYSGAVGYSNKITLQNSTWYTTQTVMQNAMNALGFDRIGNNLIITTNYEIVQQ